MVLLFSPLFPLSDFGLVLSPLSEHILGVTWPCYSVPCPQTQVFTITMAVMVYTVTMADGAARVRFSGPLQTYNCAGGPARFSGPIQQHLFLVSQHDTNMEDDIDWEAEWNKLAGGAWVPEARLAGSTQRMVQHFRKWWDRYTPSLPLYRSRGLYVH